jgi:hypothetical protein
VQEGVGAFLATFALVGFALGALGGAVSALLGLNPAKAFAAALGVYLVALAVPDLSHVLAFGDVVAAIFVGPLLVFLPPGAGFVAGRRLAAALGGAPPRGPGNGR